MDSMESGVDHVYNDIRESLELILRHEFWRHPKQVTTVLNSLDDAVSNNWDELMDGFWQASRGVALDAEYQCLDCGFQTNDETAMDNHIDQNHNEGYGQHPKENQ